MSGDNKGGNESSYSFIAPSFSESKCVQLSNEKTPKSKLMVSHSHPSIYSGSDESSRVTNFKLSTSSPSFAKAQFSTPNNRSKSNNTNNNYTENDFSITNPFENQSTIDSLLQPSLSPSVFGSVTNNTVNESINQSPGSFWNIDQIAIMKPTDIDLSKFHEQQNIVKLDPATELKAQKAIDNFFANGINITSPWSSSDHPHYLAIISPAVQTSNSRKNMQCRMRDINTTPMVLKSTTPAFERTQHYSNEQKSNTVGTQTMLTIPPNYDLMKSLGHLFTYNDNVGKESNEILSNSSLRRKLFFQDADENKDMSFETTSDVNKNSKGIHAVTKSEDLDAFPMPRDNDEKEQHVFPKENIMTPLLKSKHCSAKTPSSCQSPFSSSPVSGGRMFDLGTPYHTHSNEISEHSSNLFSPGAEYSPIARIHKPLNHEGSNKIQCGRRLYKNFALDHEEVVLSSNIPAYRKPEETKMQEQYSNDKCTNVENDNFEQISPQLSPIADGFEAETLDIRR